MSIAGCSVFEQERTCCNGHRGLPNRAHTRLTFDLVDSSGGHEGYDVQRLRGTRVSGTPVIRVLGIDTSFTQMSAAPDSVGRLEIASDAPSLNLQFFRSGPEKSTTTRDGVLNGVAVTRPVSVGWKAHRNRPASLHVRIGHWPTGVTTHD